MMLLLLDTNVVSELMRPRPEQRVASWVAAQPIRELAVTVVSIMEVRFGIAVLPEGLRRTELDRRFRHFLDQGFSGRVLTLDRAAAEACADVRAIRQRMGKPIGTEDAMIAGMARAHSAAVVTRDAGGFAGCGVPVLDPWRA